MIRARASVAIAAAALACGQPGGDGSGETDDAPRDPFFSADEWSVIQTLSPLPEPLPDPTNRWADDPAAAELGQQLFFESSYTWKADLDPNNDGDGSCAACHDPEEWFQQTTNQLDQWRNTPTLVNAAFYEWFLWDGGRDSMWSQCLYPPEVQLGSSRLTVVHMLFDKYREEYDAIFEPDLPEELDPGHPDAGRFPLVASPRPTGAPNGWESMTPQDQEIANRIYSNFGKAVAAYQRRLVSRDAPFDRYVAGEHDAISGTAKDGLRLFIGKAGCVTCHNGPAFTDNKFHATGVPVSNDVPYGRSEGVLTVLGDEFNVDGDFSDDRETGKLDELAVQEGDEVRFRTKHLRQVGETPRYMHSGQHKDLAIVVDFYNLGGGNELTGIYGLSPAMQPLYLTAQEKHALTQFLHTLTGEDIAAELRQDTSKP